jgi:hypothetical protein
MSTHIPLRRIGALVLALALSLAGSAVATRTASAALLTQTLTAPIDSGVGPAVAVDGDTLVLGAPAVAAGRGAVYVYRRAGTTWTQTATLTAADAMPGDELGSSVAIRGDTIVAGAPRADVGIRADTGALYTFPRTGAAQRTQTAKLVAIGGSPGDLLGFSVAIDEQTIVGGAPGVAFGTNRGQGMIYTFAHTGGAVRSQTAQGSASDGTAGDELGLSVTVDGDTIVSGAPEKTIGANKAQGELYTFSVTRPELVQTARLQASDGSANASLGWSVAVDGDTIVAGAPMQSGAGRVVTFARTGPTLRTQTATLAPSDLVDVGFFGGSVTVHGSTILVGAPLATVGRSARQGALYTFATSGSSFRTELSRFVDPAAHDVDEFAWGVSTDGTTIVAGDGGRDRALVLFPSDSKTITPPPPPPPPPPPSPGRAPKVRRLGESHRTWRVAVPRRRVRRARRAAPVGTVFTFALDQPAHVSFTFVALNHRRHAVGTVILRGRTGRNRFAFAGALRSGRRLAAGRYAVVVTAVGIPGRRSQPRSLRFTIVR